MSDSSPATSRARFCVRLREADLGTKRFIDVEDGTKTSNDHTQMEPDDSRLAGNYAIYPGYGGKSDGGYLIDVDIDDYDGEYATESVDALPDTFTVSSPHGGEHRYYALADDPVPELRSEFGVRNPVPTWGEIRVQNGYVVGPGSELDGCSKIWCDECATSDGGHYRIAEDRKIAEIAVGDLVEVVSTDPNYYEEYEQLGFGEWDQ